VCSVCIFLLALFPYCSDWSWIEKYFEDKKSVTSDKSSELAAQLRTAGNSQFQKKAFKSALHYYNEVVFGSFHLKLTTTKPGDHLQFA